MTGRTLRRWAALLALVALPGLAGGEGPPFRLRSPLPEELPATASFGEYRATHLHAGLDFSTRGELGWPVRAAAAGEIFRLKVEPRGYGRALYVRHTGNYVTVYGHLHRFDQEALGLESYLEDQRRRRGSRYPGDLFPDPIPVRAGQRLGLSGETGGGPPHLHFELRLAGDPVDPVRHGGLRPAGFAAPVLEALWILPRGPGRVDREWGPARLPLSGRGERHRLDHRPVVEGRFDLAVSARVPGRGSLGLSRLELLCDGRRLFRAILERFSFRQYRVSGLIYDRARTGSSPTVYTYRLRAPAGLDLPGVEGAWIREPPTGDRECILRAEDATGRRAEAALPLRLLPPPDYSEGLPGRVREYRLFPGLLLVNGRIGVDPRRLPPGAAEVPGFPRLLFPGRRGASGGLPDGAQVIIPSGAASLGPVALSSAPQAPPIPEGLKLLAAPFRLAPESLFLGAEAALEVPVDDPSRASFYRARGGAWEPLGGEAREGRLRAGTRVGGTFAVLRDHSPPRIASVRVRREPRLGLRRLVFPVEEIGSGVDVEAFTVHLDGERVEAAYDPDRGWGETWLERDLAGRHAVEARCVDRAGNAAAPFRASLSL